ncbi:hypothetical protein SMA90_32245, partial [Escherichia coli]
RFHKVFESFVGSDVTEEEKRAGVPIQAESFFRVYGRKLCGGNGLIDSEWNNGDLFLRDREFLNQFVFHSEGMDEYVIEHFVLEFQGKPVKP